MAAARGVWRGFGVQLLILVGVFICITHVSSWPRRRFQSGIDTERVRAAYKRGFFRKLRKELEEAEDESSEETDEEESEEADEEEDDEVEYENCLSVDPDGNWYCVDD